MKTEHLPPIKEEFKMVPLEEFRSKSIKNLALNSEITQQMTATEIMKTQEHALKEQIENIKQVRDNLLQINRNNNTKQLKIDDLLINKTKTIKLNNEKLKADTKKRNLKNEQHNNKVSSIKEMINTIEVKDDLISVKEQD